MIVNQHLLVEAAPIAEMATEKHTHLGVSWGLTECGYDIRLKKGVWLFYGRRFVKASSMELFQMPLHLMGKIMNKSTWARLKIDASRTTNIEPGWRGYLTYEITYAGFWPIYLPAGVAIAQVMFEEVKVPAQYVGKYQDQEDRPVDGKLSGGLTRWDLFKIGIRELFSHSA